MTNIDTIVNQALRTADAADRCAAADAQFALDFVQLSPERQAGCWRGLTYAEKSRLIVRRIAALGKDWTPSVVEQFIAKYDERYTAGPVEAAIEGALERLAIEHSNQARLADRLGDMANRKAERAATTAFTNALIQYRRGVRPEILASGAQLIPSSQPGKPPHLLHIDGDWTCNCDAGAAWHWPLALVIGIEQAFEDMQTHDDGPEGEADRAQAVLAARLDATAAIIDALRAAQASEPACVPPGTPTGDDLPDDVPPSARHPSTSSGQRLGYRLATARKKSAYFTSAFYLAA